MKRSQSSNAPKLRESDELSEGIDAQFEKYVEDIQHLFHTSGFTNKFLATRIVKVRVDQWIQKLSEPMKLVAWKKNRNSYIEVLYHQLVRGELDKPFDKLPPSSALPNLPTWVVTLYLRRSNPQTTKLSTRNIKLAFAKDLEIAEQQAHHSPRGPNSSLVDEISSNITNNVLLSSHYDSHNSASKLTPTVTEPEEDYRESETPRSFATANSSLSGTQTKRVTFFSPMNEAVDHDNTTLYIKTLERHLEEEKSNRNKAEATVKQFTEKIAEQSTIIHRLQYQLAQLHAQIKRQAPSPQDELDLKQDLEFLTFLKQFETQCNTLINSYSAKNNYITERGRDDNLR